MFAPGLGRSRSSLAQSTGWLLLFGVLGCRPRVGGTCEKGDARCLDPSRQLVCESGLYIEVPCRNGCSSTEAGVSCDIAKNQAGDRCSRDEEGAAVCVDAAQLLSCRDGSFQLSHCRGQTGCRMDAGRAACDATRAETGDACREGGKKACSVDGSTVLQCVGQVMTEGLRCRGPKGCAASGNRLDCDTSAAEVGDACDPRLEGHVTCSGDQLNTLVCRAGKFVLDAACPRGKSCTVNGKETSCQASDVR